VLFTTYITGSLIVQNTITSDKLSVSQLSAISANMGSITAGDISVGSSPAISGTSMTGSGSHLYSDGRFISGNSSTNMVFDGSSLYLNGFANVNTVTSSISNWLTTTATIATFTVPRDARTIVTWQSNLNVQAVTSAKGINLQATLRILNSVNSVVGNSSFEIFAHGAPVYIGSTSANLLTIPVTYIAIVNLTAGTYRLTGSNTNTYACDSTGGFISSGVTYLAPAGGYSVNAFQIVI
jgi:hypothetical protein